MIPLTPLEWLGLFFSAALGATVALFRKYYMPSTDNTETVLEVTDTPLPTEAPKMPQEASSAPDRLTIMCEAIRDYEGGPGNRNYRNKNPGNARYSPVGYLPMYEPVGRDADGFAIFKDWATGMLYLRNLITYKVHAHPNQTLYQFMCVYAPTSDGNDPKKYATFIAHRLGLSTDTPMKEIIS